MISNRNELLATCITEKINECKIGLVIKGISDIDVIKVAQITNEHIDKKLYYTAINYELGKIPKNIVLKANIESAVEWRNTPDKAGQIVVFLLGDVPKVHSLNDLDTISFQDLTERLIENAKNELAENLPETRFWDALKSESKSFPLKLIEDFVCAIRKDPKKENVIPLNFWKLGLLRDDSILDSKRNPTERLVRNRDIIQTMGQLSDSSRRRMRGALTKSTGEKQEKMRSSYRKIMDFYRRGDIHVLSGLEIDIIEELIKTGRPVKKDAIKETSKGSPGETIEKGAKKQGIEKPLKGKELKKEIANSVVKGKDKDAEDELHELGEAIVRSIQEPQKGNDTSTFNDQTVKIETPQRELIEFFKYACTAIAWGGLLSTTRTELKDAIRHSSPDNFIEYDPDKPIEEIAGQCLFSLLKKFDDYLQGSTVFKDLLEQLIRSREELLKYLDLLIASPLVLFGGYPDARAALDKYLSAYSTLLHEFRKNEATIHSNDSDALRFVASEILRLDVVNIRTPNEWKAIISPLHPFHLWRFKEIMNYIHKDGDDLSDDEQSQLCKALPDLPHLLHFIVLSPEITGGENVVLPQAGSINTLPTYENSTYRYLGNDGINAIEDLMNRWIHYAPFSTPMVRIALLDVPDLSNTLHYIVNFLESNHQASVTIYAYFTRGQNLKGKLAQLDYQDDDYDLSEMLLSERLKVNICKCHGLNEVYEFLCEQPVHITYIFDQSQYKPDHAPRARHLLVSPLVITYQYEYSENFERGSIVPSSEAEEGVFADYHRLVERAASLPAGEQLRLRYGDDVNIEPINKLLEAGATRWLALADRMLNAYAPKDSIPLREQRAGQREIAVWAGASTRTIGHFIDILRRYNLRPDLDTVKKVLRNFSHIVAGGLMALPSIGGNAKSKDSHQKGLLGTVLAAAWYKNKYPDALIASLDSNLASQWLKTRPHSDERADLIAIRNLEGENVVVESIEVKTRAKDAEIKLAKNPTTGEKRLEGHSVDQLRAVIDTLDPIFGNKEYEVLFTPARREVLKYQLHRECFREVHDPEWRRKWYYKLKDIFAIPASKINVECRGTVIHMHLEENSAEKILQDDYNSISFVKLGSKAIQFLISPEAKEEDIELPVSGIKQTSGQDKDFKPYVNPAKKKATKKVQKITEGTSPTAKTSKSLEFQIDDQVDKEDIRRLFLRACQSYNIQIAKCESADAVVGPNVIRFYLKLAAGQKLGPFRNALEDIGREMRRSGILLNQIQNSDKIALDIPLQKKVIVPLQRGLDILPKIESPEHMPIPIGITPEGNDIIRDLGNMPHLLVGGTTGAGKTVFLYGLLSALLTTHGDPTSLRLLISTSKPEDFIFFEGLPHLETGNVIADADQAVHILQRYLEEAFQERLDLLTSARCRDIGEYNQDNPKPLPPLVVIVDEFADLADQLAGDKSAQRTFYMHLRRVAQLGRSRGIHLVLCTQRPSADLVPTNIRNLMNVRVSFCVNDAIASRMILDETGAEQLQMHGDLLFKEQAILTRAQGYFISTDELDDLLESLK